MWGAFFMRGGVRFGLEAVAVEEISESAEDAALFAASAALGSVLKDPAGQAADRQGLKPYLAGASHEGEEESFSAKHPVTDATDKFDVKVYGRLIGYDTTGVHFKDLSGL